MFKGYKNLFIILPVIILLLAAGHFSLASDFEATYPTLPFGGIALNGNSTLPQFIGYIFYFLIAIAGLVGVVAIVIGGFEFLVSAGNEGLIGEAKERIRSAVFGIILLMCTFILIKTINPELIILKNSTLSEVTVRLDGTYVVRPIPSVGFLNNHNLFGIPYAKADSDSDVIDNNCIIYNGMTYCPAPEEDPNLDNYGINTYLYRKCNDNSIETITMYTEKDFGANTSTESFEAPCGWIHPLSGKLSFRRKMRQPDEAKGELGASGIYLYSNAGCTGDSTYDPITTAGGIPSEFLGFKSVKVINDPNNNIYWGFILNAASGFRGGCSNPAINTTKTDTCFDVSVQFSPQYINIFNWNPEYGDKKNSQNGLSIYGMPIKVTAPPDTGAGTGETPLPEAPPTTPFNQQDYSYIPSDKIVNQYYYDQNGDAYYQQLFYNISGTEIANQITQNRKGYYECLNDPGLLLKGDPDVCGESEGSGTENICEVTNPPPPIDSKNCSTPNSPYCIQSIESRGDYLYVLLASNEKSNPNGENNTCAVFGSNIYDLSKIEFMQNGRNLYRLYIIPIQ